jgi:DNA repair protein RadD
MMQRDLFSSPIVTDPRGEFPHVAGDGPPPGRHYQVDVLDRARLRIGSGKRRGIIQGETGSGKTWTYAELARGALAKERSVLIVADRRRLIQQMGGMLDRFGLPYGVVMAGDTRDVSAPIILGTRDTLAAWAKAGRPLRQFNIVIVDECHRAMGAVYQWLLAMFPDAVHIGGTATPARSDGRGLGDFYQWMECMVPASQLIAEGWLIQPEIKAPLELAAKRRSGQKTAGRAGCPVSHWKRYAEGLRTIAFAANVNESLGLRERFNDAGIPAEHIDASHDDAIRDRAYRRLQRAETLVLCTVGLAIEGVDVAEIAAAILWRKFSSLVMYRQALGRIMRPCEGKTRAVGLDHVGAAGIHGLPGADRHWPLESGRSVEPLAPEQTVVYCPECGLAFAGEKICPSCGWRRPTDRQKRKAAEPTYKARDELLLPYDGPTAQEIEAETRQRFWQSRLGIAANKGMTAGAAAAMFQKKFHQPPWTAGVHPLPAPGGDWKRPVADLFPEFVRRKGTKAS